MTAVKKQRIINCVSQLPYKIQLGESDDDWKIKPLQNNSALFSSFQYLNESEDYEQHIVAWTGEITRENNGVSIFSNEDNINQKLSNDLKDSKIDDKSKISKTTSTENPTHPSELEEDPLYLSQSQLDKLDESLKEYSSDENSIHLKVDNIHPVWLLRRDQNRWRKYAENVIWPTFHYILKQSAEGEEENNWWYDYVRFNEAYAMEISKIYQNGDIIWVHDYYLLLLPQLLRMQLNPKNDDKNFNLKIAYFHHSPWPSNEYFRCLPRRKQILDGLLGADRICFQNDGFSRHFVSSCKRLLDSTSKKSKNEFDIDQYQISAYGGDVIVDSLPIGIDTKVYLEKAFDKDIDSKVLAIKQAYQDKKIIIGRDRLNEVSGVIQKLRAFETFLAMYPEWRDKVVLIQVSSPTNNKDSQTTIKLEQQVNDLVNSINVTYGNLNFSPVQHYYMRIPTDVYFSLFRSADLCLVTTVRDGINTTSLEYVTIKSKTSQFQCYGDPLILSEFSGSCTVLDKAIIVNPWDSVAVAKSINSALNLTVEQKYALQEQVWSQVPTIQDWTDKFLATFKTITEKFGNDPSSDRRITPALNRPILLENYNKAKRRLFLFDYDGTLTPIVQDPAAAIPSARLYSILDKLVADPKNQIWIISGRDQKFLNKWLGSRLPQLGLSAEHGCFIKDVSHEGWVNLTEKYDMSWQEAVSKKMEEFTDRTPGSFIERKKVALTWHYRRAVPELGEYNSLELKNELEEIAQKYDLEVMEGKANVEVRPKFVNKGEIVKRLVWHKHGEQQNLLAGPDFNLLIDDMPDFVLCLGDDFTDEDMFRQLNSVEKTWEEKFPTNSNQWGNYGIYPVTVGSASKTTVAKSHLTDPQQVLDTLGLLIGDVNLFQSAGTVNLDTRGHVKNSESSHKSEQATVAYALRKTNSSTSIKK
ncbi:hypothetical protein Kpol_1032p34 [Vanderwaltozyma polyspora DSM 70294]|uniref:Uncharacterized protein n=1 Tax=Vanderwaltozyma polyspora (strain ATCC 22028 / DSM 70294 / BCRC 21397 / CBS 2163 / NBRC 10782 / NRRL Y-8283 / UCD 57-17) TaxID=436907 RepID=A7TGY8_VANPO|nr:uncharacterized protein Kpol_1032p34 [Vanderwaltozyma polyspora DSM 70294]EDO18440.1 hypothetical protein Kpol_1032p34 [Vanderwaltozyma polyspora DSM 70294]